MLNAYASSIGVRLVLQFKKPWLITSTRREVLYDRLGLGCAAIASSILTFAVAFLAITALTITALTITSLTITFSGVAFSAVTSTISSPSSVPFPRVSEGHYGVKSFSLATRLRNLTKPVGLAFCSTVPFTLVLLNEVTLYVVPQRPEKELQRVIAVRLISLAMIVVNISRQVN
jgi:hypothetical protein